MPSRELRVVIVGDASSLQRAVGKSKGELAGLAGSFQKNGAKMVSAGATLNRNLTLPIAAAGAASVKMALDFDGSMSQVAALTGASADQTKRWGDQILAMRNLPQTPQELAKALYSVASSGLKTDQVMGALRASARAAASGMGDVQTVAELVTSAMNAYGPKALSAGKATDILTAAVKVGKAEPDELAGSMGRVIPVAQSMGVSFAEAATSVSELTNTGLSADEAATAVRATLTGLLKPAAQTREEMQKLGLSAGGLRDEIREKGLNAALQDMAGRVGDNQDALGKLFPNVRALNGFLALTGQNADNVSGALDQVEHSSGATSQALAKAAKGPAYQFHRELRNIDAAAIQIGNDLLPVVEDLLGGVEKLAGGFSHLSDTEKHAIEIAGGIAAAAGPVLTVAGNMMKLAVALKLVGRTAPVAAAGMGEAEAAAAGSSLALGPMIPLLAAAAAGYELWTHRTKSHVDVSKQFTTAEANLNQRIATGQMSAEGWNRAIADSTRLAGGMRRSLAEVSAKGQMFARVVGPESKKVLDQYIAQQKAIATQASIAAQNLSGKLTPSEVRAAREAARFARTAAQLARAINDVPSTKRVDLILNIVENFRTEGIAPGMGADESSHTGPGGQYHPPTVKGPSSGTGQGHPSVEHIHINIDGREVARVIRNRNRTYLRNVGRSIIKP